MVSRNEERAVRDMGRTALEKAAKAALDTVPPGISRRFATVTKLYGNGTCDVDMGSASIPQPMLGLRMTAGCMGVSVGSRVIVDTVSHVSLVTGVLANDNLPYVSSYDVRSYVTSVVVTTSGPYVTVMTSSQVKSITGIQFDNTRDFVALYNGDERQGDYAILPMVSSDTQNIDARVIRPTGGSVGNVTLRVGVLLVFARR